MVELRDNTMSKVLFAISDTFPFDKAYAARIRTFAKLYQGLGYETEILCDYPSAENSVSEFGIIHYANNNQFKGLKKLFFLPILYAKRLDALLRTNNYIAIVSRSMFDRFDLVLSIAKKHDVSIILESCEWYDVCGFQRGRFDIRYFQFLHCMKHSYNKCNAVIAISRLLECHYNLSNDNVIRIPAILDVNNLPYRVTNSNDNVIKIMFAGSIFGGKEQFSELLSALSQINHQYHRIHLNIYGPNHEEFFNSLSDNGKIVFDTVKDCITVHGRIPQSEMPSIYTENDFGIFFRPDRKSSHAGFPTKLGEYLAAGTPVITNDTGDISLVIKDGINGYLINEPSTQNIIEVLSKCLELTNDEFISMRVEARKSAEECLHFSRYSNQVKRMMEKLIDAST